MSMLCKLSDVKLLLGIDSQDTSQDNKLTLFIKMASAKIEGFLGYTLGRASYTEELQSVNNRQVVYFNHFPIQSVASVTINGEAVEDYKLLPKYSRWGGLYRGDGWTGDYFTRGFTHDVVSGAWEIVGNYTAGYYLPNDTGYVDGAEDSLPADIMNCCLELVQLRYNFETSDAIGLKSHSEGQISDTFADGSADVGLSEGAKAVLGRYVFYGVA